MGFSAEFERIGHRIAEAVISHVVAVQLVGQLNLAAFEFLAFAVVFFLGNRSVEQQVHQLVELCLNPLTFALKFLNLAFMEHLLRLACLAGISHHILKNIVIRRHGLEYLLHLHHDLLFAYPELFGWVFRIPAHEIGIFGCAAIAVGFNLGVSRYHLARGGAGKQPTEHVILFAIRKGLFVPAHPHGGAGII